MDNQAIPITVEKIFESVQKETKEAWDKIDFRDRQVASLEEYEGWRIYKERVNEWVNQLKNMIDPTTGSGIININDNPYIIGLKYLIVSFALAQIKTLLTIPEAIKQALDEQQPLSEKKSRRNR